MMKRWRTVVQLAWLLSLAGSVTSGVAAPINLELAVQSGAGLYSHEALNDYLAARDLHFTLEPVFTVHSQREFTNDRLLTFELNLVHSSWVMGLLYNYTLPQSGGHQIDFTDGQSGPYRLIPSAHEVMLQLGYRIELGNRFDATVSSALGYGISFADITVGSVNGPPIYDQPYDEERIEGSYLPWIASLALRFKLNPSLALRGTLSYHTGRADSFEWHGRPMPDFDGVPFLVEWSGITVTAGVVLTDLLGRGD